MKRNDNTKSFFYQTGRLSTINSKNDSQSLRYASDHPIIEYSFFGTATADFLLTDFNGSIFSAVNTHRNETLHYTAYGFSSTEMETPPTLRFNSTHLDKTSQNYQFGNGNRGFSPALMRFISPDEYSPFEAGGINCYAYCNGDPINFTDPSGNNPVRSFFKGIGNLLGVRTKGASKTQATPINRSESTALATPNGSMGGENARSTQSLPGYSLLPSAKEKVVTKPVFERTPENLNKIKTLKQEANNYRVQGNRRLLQNGGIKNLIKGKPLTKKQMAEAEGFRIREQEALDKKNYISENLRNMPPAYSEN